MWTLPGTAVCRSRKQVGSFCAQSIRSCCVSRRNRSHRVVLFRVENRQHPPFRSVEALFQALREKRLEIARTQNVPPYVIFHDRTLIELSTARPASRAQMADVPGVGDTKLERYGPAFLAVISAHG